MSFPSYVTLRNIDQPRPLLTRELCNNLKEYYHFAMAESQYFTNVLYGLQDVNGNALDALRPIDHPNYPSSPGKVWQTIRKELLYEQGLTHDPVDITEVLVDSVPTSAFNVDYPNGLIVFDAPISTSSTVQMQYSYRNVQFHKSYETPWFKELQFESRNPGNIQWTTSLANGRGDWSMNSFKRIQLPCVVIDVPACGDSQPYEMGNLTQYYHNDVIFHIFADNVQMRDDLVDIIRYQNEGTIWLADTYAINAANAYPLDGNGFKQNSNIYYDFVNDSSPYRWKRCHFIRTRVSDMQPMHANLFTAMVRVNCEVIL